MKKLITTVALLTAVTATFAQEPGSPASERRERTISIGPVIGFGHTGLRNVGYDDVFKPNWNAGVTMNVSASENVGFSADVLYSVEGGRWQMANGNEVNLHMYYLRVPLRFVYYFGDLANDFRPKVSIGPSLGFLIEDDLDLEITGDGERETVASNFDQDNNGFDVGGTASLGFNYKLADRVWLNTDAYYYQGFLDVGDMNHYNANFGLRAGVAFGL